MSDTVATPTASAPHTAKRSAHPALALLIIAGAQMMVVLDATIVNIALPSMGAYFNRNTTDMTWALNAYTLAFGGLLLLGGRAGDILGRRRMFIVGLGLFTFGSFFAGISTSFPMLLAGRAVQGLGGAIASPTALSLVTNEFEEGPARNRAIAVYAAVSGAGAALGLMLGGIITEYLDWRWVLFVNVPIGIALMIGAYLYLHESERLTGRFDVLGALMSVAGMVALVYGFIHAAKDGWANAQSYTVFGAAVVLLVGFVLYEAFAAQNPMMPMRIFEERNRAGSYLIMLIVGAGMFAVFYYITFFVQQVLNYSALKAGFAFLPIALTIGVVSQIVSQLLPKIGPKAHISFGALVLIGAMFWFSRADLDSSYLGWLLPGLLIMGLAMGNLFVPLTITAVSKVRNTDAGLASALLNVGQQVGGAIGLSSLATVAATAGNHWRDDHLPALQQQLAKLGDLAGPIGQKLQSAGSSGLQPHDIAQFIKGLPPAQQGRAAAFFNGPYHEFGRSLLTESVGSAFTGAIFFAAVALVVGLVAISVKKTDLPAEAGPLAVH